MRAFGYELPRGQDLRGLPQLSDSVSRLYDANAASSDAYHE